MRSKFIFAIALTAGLSACTSGGGDSKGAAPLGKVEHKAADCPSINGKFAYKVADEDATYMVKELSTEKIATGVRLTDSLGGSEGDVYVVDGGQHDLPNSELGKVSYTGSCSAGKIIIDGQLNGSPLGRQTYSLSADGSVLTLVTESRDSRVPNGTETYQRTE